MRAVLRETERKLIGGCFSCRVTQEGELRTGEGGETREKGSTPYYSKKNIKSTLFSYDICSPQKERSREPLVRLSPRLYRSVGFPLEE